MKLLLLLAQYAIAPAPPVAPVAPLSPVSPLSPVAAAPALAYTLASGEGRIFGPEMRHYPQDPADSLYRDARNLLNRGEWRKAAAQFQRVADRRPASAYAADALYWQAFSLYRIGGDPELRSALAALEARKSRFPDARSTGEAETLANRIRGALAARGDQEASRALAEQARTGNAGCDEEELSVRSSALNALMRSDPDAAQSLLFRVLDRKDPCSVPLRKNAVMLLGTRGDAAAKTRLATAARNDASPDVRADAIGYLARASGDEIVASLDAVIRDDNEEDRVRRAAVRALGGHESARAKAAIRALVERSTAPEQLRLEAISTFDRPSGISYACQGEGCTWSVGVTTPVAPVPPTPPNVTVAVTPAPAAAPRPAGQAISIATREAVAEASAVAREQAAYVMSSSGSKSSRERRISPEDAAWLRGVYPRLETNRLRSRAVSVLSRATDEATLNWLVQMISRDEEPADVRATVLSRLGRDLPIAQLGRLYDNASDRTVRNQIVSTLGDRKENEATDKLIEIVKTGTDPQLRRAAISALGRKKDPRTTQLLLELIDK